MKRRNLLTLALLIPLLPLACASLLPEPRLEDVARVQGTWPQLQLSDLRDGRKLYVTHCSGCHSLHPPGELTGREWEKVMVKMQVKARIEDGTRDRIMKYLLTYARED